MFDFNAFADMTGSFNTAVSGAAKMAASGMAVATIFDLASSRRKPNEDPDLKLPKAILKMGLLGMLM